MINNKQKRIVDLLKLCQEIENGSKGSELEKQTFAQFLENNIEEIDLEDAFETYLGEQEDVEILGDHFQVSYVLDHMPHEKDSYFKVFKKNYNEDNKEHIELEGKFYSELEIKNWIKKVLEENGII